MMPNPPESVAVPPAPLAARQHDDTAGPAPRGDARELEACQHVLIGRRRIGDGCAAYVIAEAGVNHNGSVDRALAMIDAAVAAGADAVKFQMFRAEALVTADAQAAAYQRAGGAVRQREMLQSLELDDDAFERLAAHCRARGCDFLATPFSPREVSRLVAMAAPAIKLASTDLTNTLLTDAARASGRPVLQSVGAATVSEIAAAVERFERAGTAGRLVLLQCVSAYPTPLEAANLGAIRTLRGHFGRLVGYSDHTRSVMTGGWAVMAGACVVEKHFTLDARLPGPDHAMSLEPQALRQYVENIRAAEVARGDGRIGMTDIEQDVRVAARRSLVAAADIPAGTRLTAEHLAAKRPGGGIEPVEIERIIGRRTRVAIAAETMLRWDMLA